MSSDVSLVFDLTSEISNPIHSLSTPL